jgi:hypothetical protein
MTATMPRATPGRPGSLSVAPHINVNDPTGMACRGRLTGELMAEMSCFQGGVEITTLCPAKA